MIANEEHKRSHLRGIIAKLKSQKNKHSSAIDSLISDNDKLSREVLEGDREVRNSRLEGHLKEERLGAVTRLQDSLLEGRKEQDQVVQQRGVEMAKLRVQVEEMRVRAEHWHHQHRYGVLCNHT